MLACSARIFVVVFCILLIECAQAQIACKLSDEFQLKSITIFVYILAIDSHIAALHCS